MARKLPHATVSSIEASLSPGLKKTDLEAIAKAHNITYLSVWRIQRRLNQVNELGFDLRQAPSRPRNITVGIEAISYNLKLKELINL
jgi:hypothetical protein